MSLLRRNRAVAVPLGPCVACGQPCSESDATVVMHGDCVTWVRDTFVRESSPYRRGEYGGGETREGRGGRR
jgi:hypothetical protein